MNIVSRSLPLLTASLLLAACASPSSQSVSYRPEIDARIRVYWSSTVYFHFNATCVPKQSTFGGFPESSILVSKVGLSAIENKSIGMPLPSDAARYYREYVVPAGQPLTVSAQTTKVETIYAKPYWVTYAPGAGTFVPQAGQDYEIIVVNSRVYARHLLADSSGVTTEPMSITKASSCE